MKDKDFAVNESSTNEDPHAGNRCGISEHNGREAALREPEPEEQTGDTWQERHEVLHKNPGGEKPAERHLPKSKRKSLVKYKQRTQGFSHTQSLQK